MDLYGGMGKVKRHNVFISYHHANDETYKIIFEKMFAYNSEILVSKSVQIGDIDPYLNTETVRQKIRDEYLRDSSVTVVLVGRDTWKRKHVDWEIGSSIRDTQNNPRSGLLGILLPTYPDLNNMKYNPYSIPPRLYDNIKCGFAEIYTWNTIPNIVQAWIHEAFIRKDKILPDNSYPSYANNRADDARGWSQ